MAVNTKPRHLTGQHQIALTSFQLKLIATFSMLMDHIGLILFPDQVIFYVIGRLAFPIYCYLLVEGFFHTRNLERYLLRLGLFALLSEIPFDLAYNGIWWDLSTQNVFCTLFLGFAMMMGLKYYQSRVQQVLVVLVAVAFAAVFSTDYGFMGIFLILVFYLFRDYREVALGLGALWNFCWPIQGQYFGALAVFPLAFYNGERGRDVKWAFYFFYPIHFLVLYGVKLWMYSDI